MRKLIFQNMMTLDGFFEGPNREIDWHVVDDEFNAYAIDLHNSVDTLLFGRVTYELMVNYWPTEEATREDPIVAEMMNSFSKIVFSTTLQKAVWKNTRMLKGNVVEEIVRLKGQSGKDIAIFGSANLAISLIQNDLVDEYRIFVNPVILGEGRPLFPGIKNKLMLKLLSVRAFNSGLVLLTYQPIKK